MFFYSYSVYRREEGCEGSSLVLAFTFLLLLVCRSLVQQTPRYGHKGFLVPVCFFVVWCTCWCGARSWVKTSLQDKLVDTIMALLTPLDRHSRKCFMFPLCDGTGNVMSDVTHCFKGVIWFSPLGIRCERSLTIVRRNNWRTIKRFSPIFFYKKVCVHP